MSNKQNQEEAQPGPQSKLSPTRSPTGEAVAQQETTAQPDAEPSPLTDDPLVRHDETHLDEKTGSEDEDQKLSKLRIAAYRRALKMPASDD